MKKLPVALLLTMLICCASPLTAATVFQDTTKTVGASQTSETSLTNRDILEMHQAGLSAEIISAKITASRCSFETSAKALQELKEAGITEAVILEIVKATIRATAGNKAVTPAPAAVPAEAVSYIIPGGTPVEIETAHEISSASIMKEDLISFRVITPVRIDGVTLIEPGAIATARVIQAKRRGRMGKAGQFAWVFEEVMAVDGRKVSLTSQKAGQNTARGESNTSEVVTKAVVTTAAPTIIAAALASTAYFNPVLIPFAAMYGFRRGKDAVVPRGKRFLVFVRDETSVMIRANGTNVLEGRQPLDQ